MLSVYCVCCKCYCCLLRRAYIKDRQKRVGILYYELDEPQFDSRQTRRLFLYSKCPDRLSDPPWLISGGYRRVFSPIINWQWYKSDRSSSPSEEVKYMWSYIFTPSTSLWCAHSSFSFAFIRPYTANDSSLRLRTAKNITTDRQTDRILGAVE